MHIGHLPLCLLGGASIHRGVAASVIVYNFPRTTIPFPFPLLVWKLWNTMLKVWGSWCIVGRNGVIISDERKKKKEKTRKEIKIVQEEKLKKERKEKKIEKETKMRWRKKKKKRKKKTKKERNKNNLPPMAPSKRKLEREGKRKKQNR